MRLPIPDSVLLARIRVGDRRAWRQLHERYYLTLYATAFGLHHDDMATETAVEDVFEEVWDDARMYRPDLFRSVQGWLQNLLRERDGSFTHRRSPPLGIRAIEAE